MDTHIELSKEQIEDLFTFVESKNVKYIDVQYELVDHLASVIETELTNQPTLDFKEALNDTYARFQDSGFGNLVKAKEKTVTQY